MGNVIAPPIKALSSGVTVTATSRVAMSAADNYIIRNSGRVVLLFIKTGAGAATITVVTPGTVDGNAVAEQTFQVPATTGVVCARFNPSVYNDASGDLDVSTDEDTGIIMYVLEA